MFMFFKCNNKLLRISSVGVHMGNPTKSDIADVQLFHRLIYQYALMNPGTFDLHAFGACSFNYSSSA